MGFFALASLALTMNADAQSPPTSIATKIPVRDIGRTIRTSAITFGQVQHFRRLSDGRALVNDPGRHQVLLLDSTLANPVIVIDSVGGHDNSYGTRSGGLLPYRGDSTIFADPTSSTLLIIDPSGKIARVMSIRTQAVNYLTSPGSNGYPSYSERFGLVFRMSGNGLPWPQIMPPEGAPEVIKRGEDSGIVVTLNVATRKIDTVAKLSEGYITEMKISYNNVNTTDIGGLFPSPDDWAVTADGSIALLGGREYRLRWINAADGIRTESPRLPFTWRHNDDDEKQRLTDSINDLREKNYQDRVAAQKKQIAKNDSLKKIGQEPLGTNGQPIAIRPPTRQNKLDVVEIPDYMPAYDRGTGTLRGDADNNLWIRPKQTKSVPGGPIYDIVNRKGELVDRVQLAAGRSLIGFGPGGLVYLAVRDAGATRIEEVRFKD